LSTPSQADDAETDGESVGDDEVVEVDERRCNQATDEHPPGECDRGRKTQPAYGEQPCRE